MSEGVDRSGFIECHRRYISFYKDRYVVAKADNDVELVMWRMVASGKVNEARRPQPSAAATIDEAICGTTGFSDSSEQRYVDAVTIDADRMPADGLVEGPALPVAVDTTVVAPSGYCARMTQSGHFIIHSSV